MVLFFSCTENKKNKVSFYYWKTNFNLTETEKNVLQKNKVEKLYVRYFDVDLQNEEPMPVTSIKFISKPILKQIIPTIFIKNKVFLNKKININNLVIHILKLINEINSIHKITNTEIQIDCDWSLDSRDTYMDFLKILKAKYGKIVSATIRLHQIKYFEKTKVPPVDYGVLMLYNIGSVNAFGKNAIYDKEIALQYLPYLAKYPLAIKTALPIFSWLVHTRNHRVLQIISKKNISEYNNKITFVTNKLQHTVTKNGIAFGDFYKKGDILFEENILADDLEEMKKLVNKYSKTLQTEFIYYELDEKNLKKQNNDYIF